MNRLSSQSIAGIGMTSARTRQRLVERLREGGVSNQRVLDAVAAIPRHQFVDEAMASRAYEDNALPIGRGQTISQPLVVGLMTQAILVGGSRPKVLEIGTGSGYQAAVLSQVVSQVFTVERIDELSRLARRRFRALKIRNVRAKQADGHLGWPQNGPYDAVLITAAAGAVPQALFDQVAPGGVLVAPVGPAGGVQRLLCFSRRAAGFDKQDLGSVVFVPMLPGLD